jgi:hypothetical protein
MATKEQWETFRYIYEQETARYRDLNARGKVYLSLTTIYLGAVAFKAEFWFAQVPQSTLSVVALIALLAFFVSALCAIVAALGIYTYEGLANPEGIIRRFGEDPPTNEDFFDDRIIDATVATNHNSATNDKRARLLRVAPMLLIGGILTHVLLIIWILYAGAQL